MQVNMSLTKMRPPRASPDFGIKIGIGLETEGQARFRALSCFARSKRSIMLGVNGC